MSAPDSPVMLSPAEMVAVAENTMTHKALNRPYRAFMLALSGGGCIALGVVFFATLPVTIGNIVGGGIMIGTYDWLTFREGEKHELTGP